MAAARSKVGILQPGCPRIALASCPACAAHRLTDHPSVRRQCLAFLRQPELSAPVGGRAPGLRSEGSWLAAELMRRKICIVRSLSPYGVLNSGHKLTVTYYGEITIEPILNPEFDVDHDFEVKNGCFQSLFPRFRVISAYSTGRASHSDHFSGQVSMATILQDFYLFRRDFQLCTRDHLPDEG